MVHRRMNGDRVGSFEWMIAVSKRSVLVIERR